jgi:uncharacterized membrane protein YGL010W
MQWWVNWRARHQHPASLGLHFIGVPMTIAALVLAVVQLTGWRWDLWWRPAALLVGGYLLQWVGHLVEGNTMGEIILIRRWRGSPYIAVSPRYAQRDSRVDTSPPPGHGDC